MMRFYSIFIFLFLISSCAFNGHQVSTVERSVASSKEASCVDLAKSLISSAQKHNVQVSKKSFIKYYDDLNDTLSGNLSTVFRSEWKAKEDYDLGSQYMIDVLKAFGGESLVAKFSHLRGKQFIDRVVDHLKEIRKIGKISMRDPPAPKGSFDRTFTYYTKALTDGTGAKHQVRLRTYLREIVPSEMVNDLPIQGFYNGQYIEIVKIGPNKFKYRSASSYTEATKEYSSDVVEKIMNLDGLKKVINNHLTFYAYPHAKGFKLEIKTRPHDEVNNKNFEKLLGKNYVQKLSVDVNPEDILLLFKDKKTKNPDMMRENLELLKERVSNDPKNATDRINAVFNLLFDANDLDANFFVAQGATEYRRHALELEVPDMIDGAVVRIQTTLDYDMGVRKNYDSAGNFLNPFQSLANPLLRPFSTEEDLHIELKAPKVLVERTVKEKVSDALLSLFGLFNSHQVTNKGKFKHISNQADILD